MSKTRVSIVAERLGVETKEVLARLKSLGYDVKSGASTVDDEAVAKLSVSQAKDSSSDEVRVTSTIVRRRAKPAAESSGESPADEVSGEPAVKVAEEAPVAEKKPLPAVEKPVETKPAVEQPVVEKPVVEKPKKQAEPEKAVVEKAAPEKPVAEKAPVQQVAEEVKEAKAPEAQATEAQQKPKPAPAAAVVPEPAKPAAQPEVTTSNKARILGRVEITVVQDQPPVIVVRPVRQMVLLMPVVSVHPVLRALFSSHQWIFRHHQPVIVARPLLVQRKPLPRIMPASRVKKVQRSKKGASSSRSKDCLAAKTVSTIRFTRTAKKGARSVTSRVRPSLPLQRRSSGSSGSLKPLQSESLQSVLVSRRQT
jgi:hypothetical protein